MPWLQGIASARKTLGSRDLVADAMSTEGEMTHGSIRVGEVEITALCDVVDDFPAPLHAAFPDVASDAWEVYRKRFPTVFAGTDRWRLHDHCFLLRSSGQIVLVDAGVGPVGAPGARWIGRPGRLLDELAEAGTAPEDVGWVVLTHLHLDHVGWVTRWDEERPGLVFPRARHVVNRADWEAFPQEGDDNDREAFERCVRPLEALGVLELVDDDRSITPDVTVLHTPGHTPGSQSVLVESSGSRTIAWGDAANHPAQVTEPEWCSIGDWDPGETSRTRRILLDRAEREEMTVAPAHFAEPFGTVVLLDTRTYWRSFLPGQRA